MDVFSDGSSTLPASTKKCKSEFGGFGFCVHHSTKKKGTLRSVSFFGSAARRVAPLFGS